MPFIVICRGFLPKMIAMVAPHVISLTLLTFLQFNKFAYFLDESAISAVLCNLIKTKTAFPVL
jgi:hypothetical protein